MASVPHNTVSCFTLDFSGNRQSEVIKFDKEFKFLNVTVRKDGWIKWDYDSTNLENYNFKFKLALAGLNGGGSINLNFWLEEVTPTTPIPANGYPVEYVTEFKEDTYTSVRHTANRSTVLGGLVYQLEMKLDQQHVQMPRINDQRTRWFRLRIATRAPLSCAASDSQLNGFRVPIENSQNGLLPGNEYATFYFPFISLYLEKASTSLLDTDLTSMQIVTFNDLTTFRNELVEDINVDDTDINSAITTLIGDSGEGITIEEVREALITDLSDEDSEFSVAVLDLVNGPRDFTVEPVDSFSNTPNVAVLGGNDASYKITLLNGTDIADIEVSLSDDSVATAVIQTDQTSVYVNALKAVDTVDLVISLKNSTRSETFTIKTLPSQGTFTITDAEVSTVVSKMWVSLDKTTGKLTATNPNGTDIILAGQVVTVNTTTKTAQLSYLHKNPSNYQLKLDTGYTPAEGDPIIIDGGVGKATGYTVPNCTYDNTSGFARITVTASDVETLDQYKTN